jgi:hypothetical protein
MIRDEWSSLASATAAVCLALVFLRAAGHKLSSFASFVGFLRDYRVVPDWSVSSVALAVVSAEVLLVLALGVPPLRTLSGCLAIALLLAYALAMSINLVRGRHEVECGCGGAAQPIGWALVARNIVLIAPSGFLLVPEGAPLSGEGIAVAIAGGMTLWIVMILIEQVLTNGSRMRTL